MIDELWTGDMPGFEAGAKEAANCFGLKIKDGDGQAHAEWLEASTRVTDATILAGSIGADTQIRDSWIARLIELERPHLMVVFTGYPIGKKGGLVRITSHVPDFSTKIYYSIWESPDRPTETDHFDQAAAVAEWLNHYYIRRLNMAGCTGSQGPGIHEWSRRFFSTVLELAGNGG